MIPKIVHYCWLSGDPLPEKFERFKNSWEKYLNGYQFMLWDLNRFDINKSIWVKQAFEAKKYAFAADYIRLYALYNYGGIYLDLDVEVLKCVDAFLSLDTMLCFENATDARLEVAAFGVAAHSAWIKCCLDYYEGKSFVCKDGSLEMKVLPLIIRDCLYSNNYILKPVDKISQAIQCSAMEIPVFPCTYFSPKSYITGNLEITSDTFLVHHFSASWHGKKEKFYRFIMKIFGLKIAKLCAKLYKLFHSI